MYHFSENKPQQETGLAGNQQLSVRYRKLTPGLSIVYSVLLLFIFFFFFSSCEEQSSSPEEDKQESLLQGFARENNTLRIIGNQNIQVIPGQVPFMSTQQDMLVPENLNIMIPGRATSDGMVHPGEMLVVLTLEGSGPFELASKVPATQWLRLTGQQFFPGDTWTPDNGEISFPGDAWLPDELSELDVLLYSGEHSLSDIFGEMDLSDYEVDLIGRDSIFIESDKEQVALVAPADELIHIDRELNTALHEVVYEQAGSFNIPTETGAHLNFKESSSQIMPASDQLKTGNNPFLVSTFSGEEFFPDDFFTPSTVSVFTAPLNEVFPTTKPSSYDSSYFNSETRMVVFGSDYFVDAPNDQFTVTEPGEELDVRNTQVFIANSVMDINPGFTILFSPVQTTIAGTGDQSYWPEAYYHPGDFQFPDGFFFPGSQWAFVRITGYYTSALQEMGEEIPLNP